MSGPDLDTAIATARLRFGPQTRVLAARRVSRGVPGLGGKVSVEVWVSSSHVAVGTPVRDPSYDATAPAPFDPAMPHLRSEYDTLDTLLARANAADTVDAGGADFADERDVLVVLDEPHPAPDILADPLPPPAALPSQRSRRWSKTALSRLGVPGPVLAALTPPGDPTEGAWVAALAGAIARTLPQACLPGVAVAHGTGGDGALMLLRTGLAGVAMGTLTTATGPLPATPVALAAAIGGLL